jgi:adenine-specific DNA methylase
MYSEPGQTILDPFCGSGTVAVEALAAGRGAINVDIDPVAVFVTRAKTKRMIPAALRRSATRVLQSLSRVERSADEYENRKFDDLAADQFDREIARLRSRVPAIPNIDHWFRRYVVVDLASMLKQIDRANIPETHRDFLRVVFASVIRKSSNADPVPVSGLEVTSHMRRRDEAGRLVNPFALFRAALAKALTGSEEFYEATTSSVRARTFQRNAAELPGTDLHADVVITSPPYHGAVDYYRRHTLEMYWLGQTQTQADRLALLGSYIGRLTVPKTHRYVSATEELPDMATRWERRIRKVSSARANGFRHYATSMKKTFESLADIIQPGGRAVFVVGNSRWQGHQIPTDKLLVALAE